MSQTSKSPRAILRVAHRIAEAALPAYSHINSPRTYTQHQVFACLVLKSSCQPARGTEPPAVRSGQAPGEGIVGRAPSLPLQDRDWLGSANYRTDGGRASGSTPSGEANRISNPLHGSLLLDSLTRVADHEDRI